MKYWNKARIRRRREREQKIEQKTFDEYIESERRKRTYEKGDTRKNARLIMDALGNVRHRKILARLRGKGAMSVSHLVEPFNILLSRAMVHVSILEQAGLITTHKRGRIRFCVYNPAISRELVEWLRSDNPFDVD